MDLTSARYNGIPSPALLFYPEVIKQNILQAIHIAGNPERLRPHIKTHKSKNICLMMLEMGINKIKCTTLAEAEMAAVAGIPDILIAYQLTPLQLIRLNKLNQKFPDVTFSVLIDKKKSLDFFIAETKKQTTAFPRIFLDLNVGQNRCGSDSSSLVQLLETLAENKKHLTLLGLHAYDGHIHESNLQNRKKMADDCISLVDECVMKFRERGINFCEVIIGGSPAFQIYAESTSWNLSPGTVVLWDKGYGEAFPDLPFKTAAIIMGSVISTPVKNQITADLGTKALSCDGPGDPGEVIFPSIEYNELNHIFQSEEHWVLGSTKELAINDKIFVIPHHICTTVALYENVWAIIEN
jgi:D-serine deaminase-like pyridoxal phosphate-dependent protein